MTLAHPAAILPLRRLPLPVVPMVIASMVPDIPMFLPSRGGYALTHSPLGVLTVNMVAALVLLAVWNFGVRDALVDMSPAWVRGRLARRSRLSRTEWLLAPISALLGALTHVVWDAFTHANRWGVDQVGWLRGDHHGLPGYRWAQYVSGVVGLAAVVWACLAYVRARPVSRQPDHRTLPAPVLPCVLGGTALAAFLTGSSHLEAGIHAVAFHGVVSAIQVGTIGIAFTCGVWLAAAARYRVGGA